MIDGSLCHCSSCASHLHGLVASPCKSGQVHFECTIVTFSVLHTELPLCEVRSVPLQARIAEYIRQKNIEENYESAMEFNPEVFASVTMLYVNMDVGFSPVLLTCKMLDAQSMLTNLVYACYSSQS